jgi:hypothetical protein
MLAFCHLCSHLRNSKINKYTEFKLWYFLFSWNFANTKADNKLVVSLHLHMLASVLFMDYQFVCYGRGLSMN